MLGTRGGGRNRCFLLFHRRSFPSTLRMEVAKHTGSKSHVQDLAAAIQCWPLRPLRLLGLPRKGTRVPGTVHVTGDAPGRGRASPATEGGRAGLVNSDRSLLVTEGPAGGSGPDAGGRRRAARPPGAHAARGPDAGS